MKTAQLKTVSTLTPRPARRLTKPTLRTLQFIHRFRHVTTRHLQLALGHTTLITTNNHLARLCAQGYLARRYDTTDKRAQRPASYYLTPLGLALLKQRYPQQALRRVRSLTTDSSLSQRSRERYHVLTDVYAHFKRHYDGCFEFFSAVDLVGLDCMPDETPDGFVRVHLPGLPTQQYFIEIYGWGRSTPVQRRRLYSYFAFAEAERWQPATDGPLPRLFVVAGGTGSQSRLDAELRQGLEHCLSEELQIFTTTAGKLDTTDAAIWREVTVD